LATEFGEDVLSLYDTLYHAYTGLSGLRGQTYITQQHISTGHNQNNDGHSNPTDVSEGPSFDDSVMMFDDMPCHPHPPQRNPYKLQLRHENEARRRLDAILAERPARPGFPFICPLCPGDSYFNRGGLLDHLYELRFIYRVVQYANLNLLNLLAKVGFTASIMHGYARVLSTNFASHV